MGGGTPLSGAGLKDVLAGVAKLVGIDTSGIERQVNTVMNSEITYLPVRHHSPASAFLVKHCITTRKPKLVLIEGPCTADPLIQYMVASDTVPPFAILSMFTDDQNFFKLNGVAPFSPDVSIPAKFQAYYPFISYSPELVALTECAKREIPVNFIDLPLTGIIPYITNFEDKLLHFLKNEEKAIFSSRFFQKLIEVFHFEDFNEVWDSLFEIGIQNMPVDTLRENLLYFCACVRQTIDSKSLQLDGTLAREQFMKHSIERHIADSGVKPSQVLVITGGMHSLELPNAKAATFPFPTKGFLNSLVPFSYFRISDSSGYGSGNQGPSYYERAWDELLKKSMKPYELVTLDFIVHILEDARIKEQSVSIADSIDSFQNAKLLALMRRRHEPCMKDLVDAIYMTLVKGNPDTEGAYLKPLIRDRLVGHKVGRITKKMGRLPLQEDFYLRFESLGIELSEKSQNFSLNLRSTADVVRSVLFWRVSYLGLGILDRTGGPDLLKGVTGVFTETWILHWLPDIDVKLIELNIYGSSVEEASRNKMLEELKKEIKNFEHVSNLLFHSIGMGFTSDFASIHATCMDSLDHDDNFLSLAGGFLNVIMIYHLFKVMMNQQDNLDLIEKLLVRNYFAVCFALPNQANPKDDAVDPFVLAIKKLATTLISFTGVILDKSAFVGSLKTCMTMTNNEFIKGCCVGILHLMNEMGLDEVKRLVVEYAKSEPTIKLKVGEFVRGIIFECQAQFLFNTDIVKLLDDLIGTIEWPIFVAILPSLKKSFTILQPREYDIFVEKLAELYNLKATIIKDLKDEIKESHVALFAEINEKVHSKFKEWFGEI
nr:DUF5682 family protein [Candidatus Sigynarchaeota archaeon]